VLQQTSSSLQPFLDRLTSRSVLSQEEQQAILGLPTRAFQAARNQDFVQLSKRVDHACVIVDGLVGCFDQNPNGGRQITAVHIPGDMPDLLSVVLPTATTGLQALSITTILQIPHRALREVAAAYPAVAEAFWRDCIVDTMIMGQWVVNVGRRNAKQRLAHLLCEMAVRLKASTAEGRVTFPLRMTQEQLADATGLTPVHVNRCLTALRDIGVTFRASTVRIEDWTELVNAADFDPSYLQVDFKPTERMRIDQLAV
jgi:CRP-like cAMP-binding protein